MKRIFHNGFARIFLCILCLNVLLCGCSSPTDYVHMAQEYFTSLKIGTPEIVETSSADRFTYRYLNEEEKIVYDQFYDCIVNFKESIPVSTKSSEILSKVYTCINCDYGEIFWVDGYEYRTYTHGDYVTGILLTPNYTMNMQEKDALLARCDEVANEWLSAIPVDADDYLKSKIIFEKLISDVDYKKGVVDNQNMLSVFLNRVTVCQGYACASSYMFRKLGIPSAIITGYANGESHAWNIVELDGENYFFDVTWGNSSFRGEDKEGKITDYSFLNFTTERLLNTHKIDMPINVPDCTATRDGYFVREGLFFDTWSPEAVGTAVNKAYMSGQPSVSLMFDNNELYMLAKEYLLEQRQFTRYCPGMTSIAYLDDADMDVLTLKFN